MPEITITGLRIQPTSGVRTPKEIRAYARSDFQLNDAAKTLVKESSPHDSGPHIKVANLDADGEGWLADDFTLHSTTDSLNNPAGARWGLAVFDTTDRFMYWVSGLESFFLTDSPTTQNPEDIIAYNGEPITPAPTAERTAAYYSHLNVLLEPLAVLPVIGHVTRPFTNYVIGDDEYFVCWNAWFCAFNSGAGRFDLRDPSNPITLRDITVNSVVSDSHFLLSDPSLPSYSDPVDIYHERRWMLETQLKTRYRGIGSPAVDTFNLFGAYGAIVTSVSQYETPYFVAIMGEGDWLNMWNEMGDIDMFATRSPATFLASAGNGVFRFGLRLNLPMTKYHMSGIRIGPSTAAENPSFTAAGGMFWVNVPSDWSKVEDPKTYLFRDDCMGAAFDTAKWNVRATSDGVILPDPLYQWHHITHTVPGWGVQGLDAIGTYTRASEPTLEFDIVARDGTTLIAGWLDNSGSRDYVNFSHGILLDTNTTFNRATIFEDSNNRIQTAVDSIADDRIYHVKIKVNANGSATYQIQGKTFEQLGGPLWTTIAPGTSASADNVVRPAIFVSFGDAYINDIRVY